MNLNIKQDSTVPIHRQLEEQIKQLIWNNHLIPGNRLPSVRELAGFLRINRNTIARAYEGLEREGFVQSLGAKGTFVSEQPPVPLRQAELGQFLSQTLQRAEELGLTSEQLAIQLLAHSQTAVREQKVRKLLLVECNLPQLAQFRSELEKALPVIVDTLLLTEINTEVGQRVRQNLGDYKVILTTFFHVDELEQWLAGTQTELVSLLLQDSLPTLLKLHKLEWGTSIGLICESKHGLINYQKSLHEAGLGHLKIKGALITDNLAVSKAIEGSQVVVCSSSVVKQQIAGRINAGVELICDDRSLDREGIELLRLRMLDNKSAAVVTVPSNS